MTNKLEPIPTPVAAASVAGSAVHSTASASVFPAILELEDPAAALGPKQTKCRTSTATANIVPVKCSRGLVFLQKVMGLGCELSLALPYLRRVHGMERLRSEQRYLFVCNHVSLLDTILLGGLCWRSGCLPILVLGDKQVWSTSWIKRALSRPIGYLLERGKLNPKRIEELQAFGRSSRHFHLIVFPEGTRGDGVHVKPCQPGLYYVAQQARLPMVPVFFQNMHLVSTKTGRFHPISGLRKVEVYFGNPIAPEDYLELSKDLFTEFVRRQIQSAGRPAPE